MKTPSLYFEYKPKREKVVFLICALAYGIASLDISIINVILPDIAADYHIPLIETKNLIIYFTFMDGISLPLACFLAEKYGEKIIFNWSASLFGLSSLLCAFSMDINFLEIIRGLQGMSAAGFVTVARSIVVKKSSPASIVKNLANVLTLGIVAQAFGPFIGGQITTILSWRWVFLINVPVCFCIVYLSIKFLKKSAVNKDIKFQPLAFILLTFSLGTFMHTANHLAKTDVLSEFYDILTSAFLFVLFAGGYLLYSRKKPINIINTKVFYNKIFRNLMIVSVISRMALCAVPFLLVIILSKIYGFENSGVGNSLLCYGLGVWLGRVLISKMSDFMTKHKIIIFTLTGSLISFIAFAVLAYFNCFTLLIIFIFVAGLSYSLFSGLLNGIALKQLEKKDSNHASTVISIILFICQSGAISFLYIIFIRLNPFFSNFPAHAAMTILIMSVFIGFSLYLLINSSKRVF